MTNGAADATASPAYASIVATISLFGRSGDAVGNLAAGQPEQIAIHCRLPAEAVNHNTPFMPTI
jgi:hypothetical protein